MPLPELIEIVPLSRPVEAEVTVPGSKSITNRALVLAALADGTTRIEGALWSEDTQVMVDALRALRLKIEVLPDESEPCNRTFVVNGQAGLIAQGGTPQAPLALYAGNAGTAARFLAALVCLGQGAYRLDGVARMRERPQAALFGALRELGYSVDSENDKLPVTIHGAGPKPGRCRVSIKESSQFASALLLCARTGGWKVEVAGENEEESPYVAMTIKLAEKFPRSGGVFSVEPDASSGSYFWAAGWLHPIAPLRRPRTPKVEPMRDGSATQPKHSAERVLPSCTVRGWPESDWQVDSRFPHFLPLPQVVSRRDHLGDSIMTAIVLSPLASQPIRFADLGRLRVQECERVAALREELTKCGAQVSEHGDELRVIPSPLHGAEIETYNDHRMAMCFAILGLKVPGIRIKNPACVKKTFPNFFQKLAARPPGGLGATILDFPTRRPLLEDELFAD